MAQAKIFKNMIAVGVCQMLTAFFIIIYAEIEITEVLEVQ